MLSCSPLPSPRCCHNIFLRTTIFSGIKTLSCLKEQIKKKSWSCLLDFSPMLNSHPRAPPIPLILCKTRTEGSHLRKGQESRRQQVRRAHRGEPQGREWEGIVAPRRSAKNLPFPVRAMLFFRYPCLKVLQSLSYYFSPVLKSIFDGAPLAESFRKFCAVIVVTSRDQFVGRRINDQRFCLC